MKPHVGKGMGKGKWHRNIEQENHLKVKKALRQAAKGITRTELHKETGLSRPTIDRHLKDFDQEGNLRRKGRRLYWVSNYEREKRIDEVLKVLYMLDIQGRQSSPKRYEAIDMGEDTVLWDKLTGRKILTVHMKV